MMRRDRNREVGDRIAAIAADAAGAMWRARDTLTVRMLPTSETEIFRWERRVVSFDEIEYLPVDNVSYDLQRVTSLLLCSEGAITIGPDTPVLAEVWNATLAWRMLRRMTGRTPTLQDWVMVPRAADPYRPENPLSRLRRMVQPYRKLTDRYDIAINELCMMALGQIVDMRPVRTAGGLSARIGSGVTVRQHGRRYGSFHIVDPEEGAVPVPRRLYSTFDRVLNPEREAVAA